MDNGMKIQMLDVRVTFQPMSVNPVVIRDGDAVTLVDTTFPGQFPALEQALAAVGLTPAQVKRVVITHQDLDHLGVMKEMIAARGGDLDVYAHVVERDYIEGTKPWAKLTPEGLARRLEALPPEQRQQRAAMYAAMPNFKVTHPVADGDLLPFGGGIRVIHTPGHTPGHISLWLERERTLIPGDELLVVNGQLTGPAAEHTLDMAEALRSMRKLFGLPVERVLSFHGGRYEGAVPERIRELAGA